MRQYETVTLKRDCEARLVPSGDKVTLHKGHEVAITQALGGSYTVVIEGNMALIDGRDADALGKEVVPPEAEIDADSIHGPVTEDAVWAQLKTCYDPEIPVNIVDLGLIYDLKITPLSKRSHRVDIKMTLTAPGCGMGGVIAENVRQRVLALPGVEDASVELVWEPMWNRDMMSEAARLQLGMF